MPPPTFRHYELKKDRVISEPSEENTHKLQFAVEIEIKYITLHLTVIQVFDG